MKEFKCSKCGSEDIGLRTDKRGVAEYFCEKCGAGQGKASSADLVQIIHDINEARQMEAAVMGSSSLTDDRPPCRYCTEKYVMLRGNLQTRIIQVPIEAVYCPMCGRKLSKHDKEYL